MGVFKRKKSRVLGLGAPVMDLFLDVSENFLKEVVKGEKGGSIAVGYDFIWEVIAASKELPKSIPGGSATNTIKTLARLGQNCAIIGKVGQDNAAKSFKRSLREQGVEAILAESSKKTAHTLCLITPDGERTMRTFLGASIEMKVADLKEEIFQGARILHLEGYVFYNPKLAEKAMEMAKAVDAKISLDFASFELVDLFRKNFEKALRKYVDVIFCNHLEAKIFTGKEPKEASQEFAEYCEVAVVSMAKDGCMVCSKGKIEHFKAFPVQAVDSTGAGDLFSGGFLHAYLEGMNFADCAYYGATLGRECVLTVGTEIPKERWKHLRKDLQNLVK